MKFLWHNQGLEAVSEARIDPQDRGLLLGDGLFETMRLSAGKILRLQAHLARLTAGAALLRLPLPDLAMLQAALDQLVAANGAAEGSLRLTLTRGAGPRGVLPPATPTPTLLITQALPAAALLPCRVQISPWRRDGASPLSRIKHLNYLPQILARLEASEAGFDDALLLSGDGQHIAESSAASLVILDGSHLVTPPLEDGALTGIARAALLATGQCVEKSITPDALCASRGAWLVNSLSVREIAQSGAYALPRHEAWTARLTAILAQDTAQT